MSLVSGEQQVKPDGTPLVVVAQPTPSEKIKYSVEKWVLWRGLTLAGWYWFLAALVDKAFGTAIPSPSWLLVGPVFTLLYYLCSSRKLWSLGYLFYGFFYPLIMTVLAVRAMPRLSRFCSKAVRPATGFVAALIGLPVLGLIWLLLLFSDNPSVLLVFILLGTFAHTMVLAAGIRWASDPLSPFLNILTLVDWVQRRFDEVRTPVKSSSDPAEALKLAQGNLTIVGYYEKGFTWLQSKLDGLTKRTIVPLFSLVLVLLFSITVLGYGISIFASQRLEPTAFQGKPNVALSCLWSLSIMMTAPLSEITPVSWVGYMLYGMQLVSTFFLITVFFAMFSAAMGIHGHHRIKELTLISDKVKTWIEQKRRRAMDAVAALQQVNTVSEAVPAPPPPPPEPPPVASPTQATPEQGPGSSTDPATTHANGVHPIALPHFPLITTTQKD